MAPQPGKSGFTLVEVTIAMLMLLVGAIGIITAIVRTQITVRAGRASSTSANAWMDLDEKIHRLERQIVDELKRASIVGEDVNANFLLDAGEDRNGNGRLDSDWRVTADSITFNRVLPDGNLTLPITYRLAGTEIERSVMTDTAGNRSRAVVARNAVAFATSQSGRTVALVMRFREPVRGGKTVERHRTFTVRASN